MERKKTIIISIFLVFALVAGIAGAYSVMKMLEEPKITKVTAQFTCDNGSLILVRWETDLPVKKELAEEEMYIHIQGTDIKLPVRVVPKIGVLSSRNLGKTTGFFIADNGLRDATADTLVTLVIGDHRVEDYRILPMNVAITNAPLS
jgi:hypothetical protein